MPLLFIKQMELNKDNSANRTKKNITESFTFLQPATKGWETKAYTCSSLTMEGISDIWEMICTFKKTGKSSGFLRKEEKDKQENGYIR